MVLKNQKFDLLKPAETLNNLALDTDLSKPHNFSVFFIQTEIHFYGLYLV